MSPVLWAWVLSAVGAAAFFAAGLALSRSRRRAEPPTLPPPIPPPQDHLQEELARAHAELRAAEAQLEQAQERQAQLGREAEARKLELREAQHREAQLRQEQANRAPAPPPPINTKEKAELGELRTRLEAAEGELHAARTAAKSARSEHSSLELRLSRATKRYGGMVTERDALTTQLRELEASSTENSARFRETLSAHVADAEVSHQKAESLVSELQKQREAMRHLTIEQKRQEQSLAQREASHAEHERTIQEQATQLSLAKEEVQRLLMERNRLQDDAATSASAATSDGDELERARREIGVANEALSARTRALEESRDEIALLKAQAADAPAVDSEERQELERVRREIAALREELIAKKRAFEEGRDELAQLRSVGADLQAAEEAHSHTEAEVEHLRTALAAAQTSGTATVVPSPNVTAEEVDAVGETGAVSTMSLQELIEGVEALKSVWAAAVTDTSGLVVAGAGADNEVLSAMASTLFSAARRAEKELPIGSPVEFSVLDASGFRITVRSASSRHSRLLFATLSRGTVETEQSVRRLVAAIPRVTV